MQQSHQFPNYTETLEEKYFSQELMARSKAYLIEKKDHNYANTQVGIKYISLFILMGVSYSVVLLTHQTIWFLICYILFMLFSVLLALNALHDCAHNAVFKNKKVNWWFNRIISIPLGLEPDYWRIRHNIFHHGYPNIEGHDLDIEENGIIRQAPNQKWYPHMRFQHIYWPFTASLALPYMAWYFDWTDRLGKTPLKNHNILTGWTGWLIFLSNKVNHFVICLLVPYYFATSNNLGWGWVLIAYLTSQMFASLVVIFMFLGTHWVAPIFHEPNENNQIECGWYLHCIGTTCDWDPPKFLAPWLGGADYHLTHHLFPQWHHRHYRPLANIVREICEKHEYPYRRISYTELLSAQRVFLQDMGQKPS